MFSVFTGGGRFSALTVFEQTRPDVSEGMTWLFIHWKTRRYATEDRAKNVEDFNGAQGKIASKGTLDKIKLRGAYTRATLWKSPMEAFFKVFSKVKTNLGVFHGA